MQRKNWQVAWIGTLRTWGNEGKCRSPRLGGLGGLCRHVLHRHGSDIFLMNFLDFPHPGFDANVWVGRLRVRVASDRPDC